MRVRVAVLPLLAVLALLVVPTQAIWLKVFEDNACARPSEPESNYANVVSGACVTGSDYYTYRVTCNSNTATVQRYNGGGCSTTKSDPSVVQGATSTDTVSSCLSLNQNNRYSFQVYCTDPASIQATLVKQESFNDAACTSLRTTTYGDAAPGICRNTSTLDQYLVATPLKKNSWIVDGTVREWGYTSNDCNQANAISVERFPIGTCTGVWSNDRNQTIYMKYSAPATASSATIPSALSAFPPANSVVTSVCSRKDCGSNNGASCYAYKATLLKCVSVADRNFQRTDASALYCLSSGFVANLKWYNSTTCSSSGGPVDKAVLTLTGRGSCREGFFQSCGGVTSNAPALPTLASITYNDTACGVEEEMDLYRDGLCVTYDFSSQGYASTADGNYSTTYYSSPRCAVSEYNYASTNKLTSECKPSFRGSYSYKAGYTVPSTGYIAAGPSGGVSIVAGAALPSGGDPSYPASSSGGGASADKPAVAQFTISLGLDIDAANATQYSYYSDLLQTEVARVLDIEKSRVKVLSLRAGSTVAVIEVTGAPADAATTIGNTKNNSNYAVLSKNEGVLNTTPFNTASRASAPVATLAALVVAAIMAAMRA